MNNKIINLAGLFVAGLALTACDTDFDNPIGDASYSNGDADFTKYVSLGDSLTAGYADGTLYLSAQQDSYPNIMARQFAKVGGGEFIQPVTNEDNLGGLIAGGLPILDGDGNNLFDNRMVFNAETELPERLEGDSTNEVLGSGLNGIAFNNMGVPAAKSFHLGAPTYGHAASLGATANPYFVRFSSDLTDPEVTVLGDAVVQAPSFYTLWIGANDVIWYGFAGGDNATATDQTGNFDPASYGQNDITDPQVFAGTLATIVDTVKVVNPVVQGMLVTVPDVTTIPYFTVVPYNPIAPEKLTTEQVESLNVAYAGYNAGVMAILGATNPDEAAKRQIIFVDGEFNAPVIMDEDLTDLTDINPLLINMRQANADDLIPLEQAPIIGTPGGGPDQVWGLSQPLRDRHVLIPSEIEAMKTAITAYNMAIRAIADADDNLIVYDAEAVFAELNANGGIDYGTGTVTADYVTGGFFSLDGIHPTARGYAVIANGMIRKINTGFNANIPPVDPNSYTTVFIK